MDDKRAAREQAAVEVRPLIRKMRERVEAATSVDEARAAVTEFADAHVAILEANGL